MPKLKRYIIQINIILLLTLCLVGCNSREGAHTEEDMCSSSISESYPYSTKTNLHYTLPLNDNVNYPYPFIGDVHPYYDEKTMMYYLFYLDTSGRYQTTLSTSTDGIYFEENYTFNVKYSSTPYSVLNITKYNNMYYSYFSEFMCSRSSDLINWECLGNEYQIPLDRTTYNAGMRDPSVIYDETNQEFYAIGLVYKMVNNQKVGNLAITKSIGNTNLVWKPNFKQVLLNDTINRDYECPMLMKIGNRWYIFASQYGVTTHGVGRLSYWIGDENINPYEVNWQTKEEHYLTGEDLCAAQVFKKDNQFYLMGWIPQTYNTSFWGGYVNLLTEVYALDNGMLATKFDNQMYQKIKKTKILDHHDIEVTSTKKIITNTDRFVLELDFSLSDNQLEIKTNNNGYRIVLDNALQRMSVYVDDYCVSSIDISNELGKNCKLRIIAEEKNIEIELNEKYVLTSRIAKQMLNPEIIVLKSTNCLFNDIIMYRLAYLEEI